MDDAGRRRRDATARHANVVADPHLRQGLRAGRLPGRVRRRAGADRRRACAPCSLPFGVSSRRAGRGGRLARAREAELLERVEALVAERDRVVAGAAPSRAGTSPTRRATSSGSPLGERTADFAAAADEAGIMVRPFAGEGARVTIGEPAGNDVLLEVAAALRGLRRSNAAGTSVDAGGLLESVVGRLGTAKTELGRSGPAG